MAGAATEQELALLQRLRRDEMTESLARLDEHAWDLARAVLRELAARQNYPMNSRNKRNSREARP
jgi:hypothetical protein